MKLSENDAGRPAGRERVRVVHHPSNRIVCYPTGRPRFFGTERAADDWIDFANRNPLHVEAQLFAWNEHSK